MPPRSGLSRKSKKTRAQAARISRLYKPDEMSLEEWQIELRKQFAREQRFRVRNLEDDPVFSEFKVVNRDNGCAYQVRIRGRALGENSCTCPDFATNTLGTCKHIEFMLARLQRKRDTAARLRAGFHPPYSEIYLKYGSRREVCLRLGSKCSTRLSRLAPEFFDDDGALRPDMTLSFGRFLEEAVAEDDVRVGGDVLAFLAELHDAAKRRKLLAEAFPRGIRSAAFKDLVKCPLYDYQREGALFAARAGRCLIGDEMGLGKTAQAIAAAEIMARLLGVERVLVVCPTSLKYQWQREIEKFTGRTVEVISGLRPAREHGFAVPDRFFKITNYDTVHSDLDLIGAWSPQLVILDEAQRIKNWATRVARSVKNINSSYAIVLTGTPLENRLEELVSIVQFVDRFRLGPTFRLLHDHEERDEAGKVIGYRDLNKIGQILEPILLRRQKEQVLSQLPERIDSTVYVPMTSEQSRHHDENREKVAKIVQKWRRYQFLSETDKKRLMAGLQKMRMSCDSSYLLDTSSDHGVKCKEAVTLLGEILERPRTKVVIFSQWLRMHKLLQDRFERMGWQHVLFHGRVPGLKRRELVDRFRDDPECRLFLSTDAGGVGLNLQFATVVFNMDLPWNPAVLEQRVGRVHRLGQEQPVRVVNFVAKGTIEEGMLSVLRFKRSLFAGVLDGGVSNISLGGNRLTKFMETVESVTASIPAHAASGNDAREALTEFDSARKRSPRKKGLEETAAENKPATDAWSGLLQAGMALLRQLGAPKGAGQENRKSLVESDPKTGESFLRLPVPGPEVVEQALKVIGGLLESFRFNNPNSNSNGK